MEEEGRDVDQWKFRGNKELLSRTEDVVVSMRSMMRLLRSNLNPNDKRTTVPLGAGDPSAIPCFRTSPSTEDAIFASVRFGNFNGDSFTGGVIPARKAIAEYISRDLQYELLSDDVFVTIGCKQAIEVSMTVLAYPGASILLPRPGFPLYEARASYISLEVRHYDLIPERGWEVDVDSVQALADENTVAMVIINRGNPCGNVYSYQHLEKVAQTARKLGILVISDEVHDHLVFGSKPLVRMGVFASIVHVLTLGSISKWWIVPGWRLGWLVISDPSGILRESGLADCITSYLEISSEPTTLIQAKLNLSMLDGITDDTDFWHKACPRRESDRNTR